MKFWVDVEDRENKPIGDGPLTHVIEWTQTQRLDRAGSFVCKLPADKRAVDLIKAKHYLYLKTIINGESITIGSGVIDEYKIKSTPTGDQIEVEGSDLLGELARVTTQVLIGRTNEPPTYLIYAANQRLAQSGWRGRQWGTTGKIDLQQAITIEYRYESILASLVMLAEKTGQHFTIDGHTKTLKWLGPVTQFEDAPIALSANVAAPNSQYGAITEIEQIAESWDIINVLYLFGSGSGENKTTIENTSYLQLPSGFTFNRWQHVIADLYSLKTYGPHETVKTFSDIRPVDGTAESSIAASDALLITGYNYLRTRTQPSFTYSVQCEVEQTVTLSPGQRILVQARRTRTGQSILDIDQWMYILEVSTSITAAGTRSTSLVVSTIDTWPETDQGYILERIEQQSKTIYYDQPSLNENTISYLLDVKTGGTSSGYFWQKYYHTLASVLVRIYIAEQDVEASAISCRVSDRPATNGWAASVGGWLEIDITEDIRRNYLIRNGVDTLHSVAVVGLPTGEREPITMNIERTYTI